jgi:hypothetical protein
MSIPLWDPIDIPPEFTLVDVNAIEPEDERLRCQAGALDAWLEEEGLDYTDEVVRDWSSDEGAFVVVDTDGNKVGFTFILEEA